MDSMLNKIKTKVSTVLPGNPLTREYELGKQIGCAGPGMLWKLFAAKKRSTQQEATVWAFEKKMIDSYPKSQKDCMIDLLKHGVAILTRIRHPKVLSVLQPLEESRESLAFASEPLLTSLRSVLSSGNSSNKSKQETTPDMMDVEIKYGLMQLAEALNFIHSDCHQLHMNLTPEAVVINKFGLWKLSGFEFAMTIEQGASAASVPMWQSSMMPTCQPSLGSSSPEAILQGQATSASDMFGLGLLICCLFNNGKSVFEFENDYSAYRRSAKDVISLCAKQLHKMPDSLREYVKMMLTIDPEIRPTALQFSRTPYFDDASMSVLRSVDNMYQLDNLARSQFYKSLPSTIPLLPKRLCLFRVFPQITEDFSNPHMVPFILPAVLQIMDVVTREEFVQHMLPRLIPIMSMKEPIQVILVLLQNLRVLCEKFPPSEFRLHVLQMLNSAMDTDNKAIQELCLKSLPTICPIMELNTLKNAVLPRIQKLFSRTDIPSIRIGCVVCLGKLLDHLDRWIVMDEVLPFLQQIRSREPTLLLAILGVYRIAFSHEKLGISREKLATQVLPHIIPLSVDSGLNLRQYNAFADLIRDMCARLEKEQRSKLTQLHGVEEEASIIGITSTSSNGWTSTNSCANLMDQIMRDYGDSSTESFEHAAPAHFEPASNTVQTSLEPKTTPASKTPLTLEQKRQLAAERTHQSRFQDQQGLNALHPVHSDPKSMVKHVPRDLTSSLINSNLTAIATNHGVPMKTASRASATFQPGLPLCMVRPPANPVNYLTLPHYAVGAGLQPSETIVPPNRDIPCSLGVWDPPRNAVRFGSTVNTAPSHPSLGSIDPFGLNNLTRSGAEEFKPLSKTEIDDLLS